LKFSTRRNKEERVVIDGQEISKSEYFRYLGSIIHWDREIKEDVNHKIRAMGIV
jgi:hypothetical protein